MNKYSEFTMSLQEELKFKTPPATPAHEAFLNIYFTGTCIKKQAARFLGQFGLSDAQFNLLMMLKHQGGGEGLGQVQLGEMLLVNRANVTGLVDRLEQAGLVRRKEDPEDRRANRVHLTKAGRDLIDKVDPLYGEEMHRIMGALNKIEIYEVIRSMEKIRRKLQAE